MVFVTLKPDTLDDENRKFVQQPLRHPLFLNSVRMIVLVRDPYDWVIASARFFVSEEFKAGLPALKDGSLTMGKLFNMMIFGVHQIAAPLGANFVYTALAW